MTAEPDAVNENDFGRWTEDLRGPVALTLRQKLLPIEGEGAVIFPATYARIRDSDPPYNIDKLGDGTKVAQIDSVGSQANRMEPVFKRPEDGRSTKDFSGLVPQIFVTVKGNKKEGNAEKRVSLLDAGHRLGDALVRNSDLSEQVKTAFSVYQRGDASSLAKLAPTSIIFGAWDSRGEGAKLPRLVSSIIRAWDVDELTRSAQYVPPLRYADYGVFDEKDVEVAESQAKSATPTKNPLAVKGFVEVPAVGSHGGIVARGPILRTVTVNLVALRALGGENAEALRAYILGLTLLAATDPQDAFLRQGCMVGPDPDASAEWEEVSRDGKRRRIALSQDGVEPFARNAAERFGVGQDREVTFKPNLADDEVREANKKGKKGKKDADDDTTE